MMAALAHDLSENVRLPPPFYISKFCHRCQNAINTGLVKVLDQVKKAEILILMILGLSRCRLWVRG